MPIDLEAYLNRIAYDGPLARSWACGRHCCFTTSPPFRSKASIRCWGCRSYSISDSLENKLVRGGRGGYCFEQNGLLFHILSHLGFRVTPLAARVRWMLLPGAPQTPVSHMMLMVTLDEGEFICDVGFGGQSPDGTTPFLLDGIEQQTPHGIYRLRAHGNGYELDMRLPEDWAPLYRFSREVQSPRDYEVYNWYTATHPHLALSIIWSRRGCRAICAWPC